MKVKVTEQLKGFVVCHHLIMGHLKRISVNTAATIINYVRFNPSTRVFSSIYCLSHNQQPGTLHTAAPPNARSFFKFPSPFSQKKKSNRTLEYSERRIIGYSAEQMYDVVADTESYTEFVPWCKKSTVSQRRPNSFLCQFTIGFPPLTESYTSEVSVIKPHLVKSVCIDGMLFNKLLSVWKFGPGLPGRMDTCTLEYTVTFEFRYKLHSQLARLFFDEVLITMQNAFLKRAKQIYGPQSITAQQQHREVLASS